MSAPSSRSPSPKPVLPPFSAEEVVQPVIGHCPTSAAPLAASLPFPPFPSEAVVTSDPSGEESQSTRPAPDPPKGPKAPPPAEAGLLPALPTTTPEDRASSEAELAATAVFHPFEAGAAPPSPPPSPSDAVESGHEPALTEICMEEAVEAYPPSSEADEAAPPLPSDSEGAYEPYRANLDRVAAVPTAPRPRVLAEDAPGITIPNPHRHSAPGHTLAPPSAPTELSAAEIRV
eukprot:XP_011421323.1 PREDICTED: vegetative cell wall protein gp1-like [Crassostrea gigas]